jgi:anhydro-N-acetylmuramic acid kinase
MPRSGIMVGLMSGTSADGMDVCLTRLELRGARPKPHLSFEIMYCATAPYPPALRKAILSAYSVEDVCRLNFAVAEAFAATANDALNKARIKKDDVLAISSHGQTVWHAPSAAPIGGFPSRSTLQIGDIAVIAARTALQCVGDFRTKDVALGGQGAPLVPFVEWLLSPPGGCVWLNIGGIANITVVPELANQQDVVAFDTGPGNTLIDWLVRERTKGRLRYDRGGRLALSGSANEKLVRRMLADPYFRRQPPKSTGPEHFGPDFLGRFRLPAGLEDACATLAAFTAESIAGGIRLALDGQPANLIIVSGGGTYNQAIMSRLRVRVGDAAVVTSEFVGIPSDAKEAFAFAVLGLCTLAGIPNNTPSATGASRPAVLGKVALPA